LNSLIGRAKIFYKPLSGIHLQLILLLTWKVRYGTMVVMKEIKPPDPGTEAAQNLGCSCPGRRASFNSGRATYRIDYEQDQGYWIATDCRIHHPLDAQFVPTVGSFNKHCAD